MVGLVVIMAASQGKMGEPAIRNLVNTCACADTELERRLSYASSVTWTCMKRRAKMVIAAAWTTYTKHSLGNT